MFPGYVLFKTKMTERTFHKTKELPISCRIVNNGAYYSKERKTYFTTITDEEILPIIRLIGEGDTVDYSKVYIENSKVTVASLKGMEGIIKRSIKEKDAPKSACLLWDWTKWSTSELKCSPNPSMSKASTACAVDALLYKQAKARHQNNLAHHRHGQTFCFQGIVDLKPGCAHEAKSHLGKNTF